ncbi:MAG: cytochrome c family protein, partial [Zetaproteobacteria bacterium]
AARNIGPSLLGIYGRVPSIDGVPFARWDAAALERWLSNPRAVKPNTRMRIPPLSARDRADIIAYFRQVKEGGGR